MGSWSRYTPSSEKPWDIRRAAHLHRRAAFGASWVELKRDLADGPAVSVDRLLSGDARKEGLIDGFEETAGLLKTAAVLSGDIERLKAWWLFRMLHGPDPLTEKLALMWHNHFATSFSKVLDLGAMLEQNESFRRLARAPFGELLKAMLHDPALLKWLDANTNRSGRPNENLARELMELFTLGVGHFSEEDVVEAARALTGWTARRGQFLLDARYHDGGEKTVLGESGNFTGKDVAEILLRHTATARRIAWRLCDELVGEAATDRDVELLAEGLRARELDVGWAVETVLRSELFFEPAAMERRIRGPVELLIGSVRTLGRTDPRPSTILLAEWSRRLGQDLFNPPNVGGWNGGAEWLGSRSIIGRANLAAAIVEGRLQSNAESVRPIAENGEAYGVEPTVAAQVDFYSPMVTGRPLDDASRSRILSAVEQAPGDGSIATRVAAGVALLLAMPESQLG